MIGYPTLGSAAVLCERDNAGRPGTVVSVVLDKLLVVVEDASGWHFSFRPYNWEGDSARWTHVHQPKGRRWVRTPI